MKHLICFLGFFLVSCTNQENKSLDRLLLGYKPSSNQILESLLQQSRMEIFVLTNSINEESRLTKYNIFSASGQNYSVEKYTEVNGSIEFKLSDGTEVRLCGAYTIEKNPQGN